MPQRGAVCGETLPGGAKEAVERLLEKAILPQRRRERRGPRPLGRRRPRRAVLVVVGCVVLRLRAPHLVERLEGEVVWQQRARGGREKPSCTIEEQDCLVPTRTLDAPGQLHHVSHYFISDITPFTLVAMYVGR